MSQIVKRKPKSFVGMTSFQVGVLFILGLLACGVIGLLGFFVFNSTAGNEVSGLNFTNPSGAFNGKWEIVSGSNTGSIYEFFPDGTVNISNSFGVASKYSFPDKTHIKIEMGSLAAIYQYVLLGNEIILTTNSSSITLKKYEEFSLSPQVISGTWKPVGMLSDKNECFKVTGITSVRPQEMIFGMDGTISYFEGGYYNYAMEGQYTINGNNLYATTLGIHEESGTDPLGIVVIGTPSQVQVQGEIICTVTVSNSRLTFKDTLGQTILFVRAGK